MKHESKKRTDAQQVVKKVGSLYVISRPNRRPIARFNGQLSVGDWSMVLPHAEQAASLAKFMQVQRVQWVDADGNVLHADLSQAQFADLAFIPGVSNEVVFAYEFAEALRAA